ncbi:MAG: hypothetical protein R3B89_10270 [Polyangiaceae bacterium]
MRKRLALGLAAAVSLTAGSASAQVTPPPSRDDTWGTVSTITAVGALATEAVMPRIFYSDPEVTVGWKARWHVSALAPVLTLTSLTLFNEFALKDGFEAYRPGCDESNQGGPNCQSFGSPSSHSFAAFSGLGHGAAVFLFDTTKWSNGRFNGGSFAGHVVVPAVFSVITAIGRGAGDFNSADQILIGGGMGLGAGFLTGMTYALMARPECGYSGAMVCW